MNHLAWEEAHCKEALEFICTQLPFFQFSVWQIYFPTSRYFSSVPPQVLDVILNKLKVLEVM